MNIDDFIDKVASELSDGCPYDLCQAKSCKECWIKRMNEILEEVE